MRAQSHRAFWLGVLMVPAMARAEAPKGSLPAASSAPIKAAAPKPKAAASPSARDPAKPPPPAAGSEQALPEAPVPPSQGAPTPAPKTAPPDPRKAELGSAPKAVPAPVGKAAPAKPALPAAPATTPRAPDLKRGAGARSVAPAEVDDEHENDAEDEPKPERLEKKPTLPPVTRGKGPVPAKPKSTLPPGTTPKQPDESARRQVAQGPTSDELRSGSSDPELSSLREAERVLFPKPLDGVELGFGFPLPERAGPIIDASGIPPGEPFANTEGSSSGAASDGDWLRALSAPNLPIRYDERVVRYLRFYRDTPSGRAIAKTWARKAGRYAPALRAQLARAGLPTDLVWLSLIESGHNPAISSPVGAAGLWQFMPDAGRSYGLTVDRWVDERLDPERSTEAAIRYLGDLYRRFGSWDLAMAAYNMGYGGLSRAVRKFNTNNFWELSRYEAGVPWETALYVPKILATAVLLNNRRAFGLEQVEEDAAERFDVVTVGPAVALLEVAGAAGSELRAIEDLNPQFLAGRTPPDPPFARASSYRVRVPEGRGERTRRALALAPRDDGLTPYVVRAGETVERIALAHGLRERELREQNRVGDSEVLAAGTVLLVARKPVSDFEPTSDEEVVVVPARAVEPAFGKRVFYRVVSGDTSAGVASAFRVTPSDLADWNALDLEARLEPGMTLQVFVDQGASLANVLYIPEAHAKILVAGTPAFCEYFEQKNGRRRMVIAARDGDTLQSVGKRYGVSAGLMERVNRRSRSERLARGEDVVLYTDRGRAAPGDAERKAN